ncbi:unnamed protein product [Protopolystoma xenopodis]|uniref:Uncharacterized protein n=1 Tax=Protopolystoma xenopodis TaxID=117903 RepID=A0A3S5AR27_9PLAT|nr:unnamed protein product [Protopolystoma xenopodis]
MTPSSDDVHQMMDESSAGFHPKRGRRTREQRLRAKHLHYNRCISVVQPRTFQPISVSVRRGFAWLTRYTAFEACQPREARTTGEIASRCRLKYRLVADCIMPPGD